MKPKADPYEVIGVQRKATKAEIRKTYLRKAKKIHPDVGGSTEEFQSLQRAYALLTNDKAREHFDQTGRDDFRSPDDWEAQVRARVVQLFMEHVKKNFNPNLTMYTDIVKNVLQDINSQVDKAKKERKQRSKIQRYVAKVRDRLKYVGNGSEKSNPLLLASLENECEQLERAQASLSIEVEVLKAMRGYIKNYRFEVDKQKETWQATDRVFRPLDSTFTFFGTGS